MTTWGGFPLFYYQPGTAAFYVPNEYPIGNPTAVLGLLFLRTGQCIPWKDMLKDAWAINGANANTATAISSETAYFWIDTWSSLGTVFEFESVKFDMYPYPSQDPYGYYGPGSTFKNEVGIPGQGTGAPSQKVFAFHLVLKYGGQYYDPSYGKIYANAAQLAARVTGYGNSLGVVNNKLRLSFTTSGSMEFDI